MSIEDEERRQREDGSSIIYPLIVISAILMSYGCPFFPFFSFFAVFVAFRVIAFKIIN